MDASRQRRILTLTAVPAGRVPARSGGGPAVRTRCTGPMTRPVVIARRQVNAGQRFAGHWQIVELRVRGAANAGGGGGRGRLCDGSVAEDSLLSASRFGVSFPPGRCSRFRRERNCSRRSN